MTFLLLAPTFESVWPPMASLCSQVHISSLALTCDSVWPGLYLLSALKIYHLSLFIIPQGTDDIADPSSMHDACHHEPSKYDLARHESPSDSLVRAPNRCVRFASETQIFRLSHARDITNIHLFSGSIKIVF